MGIFSCNFQEEGNLSGSSLERLISVSYSTIFIDFITDSLPITLQVQDHFAKAILSYIILLANKRKKAFSKR